MTNLHLEKIIKGDTVLVITVIIEIFTLVVNIQVTRLHYRSAKIMRRSAMFGKIIWIFAV